jgi:two-component system LytT family response regulator
MTPTPKLRVLIADDEPLARRGIAARLARSPDVEVVGECADGLEAIEKISSLRPDLVFLDVEMPHADGFSVVDAIGVDRMPTVVFVTAYDQYAIRAFDARALDYLLKPIDDDRFDLALARARERLDQRRESAVARRLSQVLLEGRVRGEDEPRTDTAGSGAYVRQFLVKRNGRVILVPVDEVDWIEAARDYVRLHVGRVTHLLREAIATVESRLDPVQFVRIHRSTLVNISRIRELHPHSNREYIVVLRDGTELKLSRGYRGRLKDRFSGGL